MVCLDFSSTEQKIIWRQIGFPSLKSGRACFYMTEIQKLNKNINCCRRQLTNLDMGYYVSCPDLFTDLYIVNYISIYENLQFRISFMTYCYVTLSIYIHTPEGYSFSRKLYGINVRNLSTPPATWYFLNSQRHDRWVSCANSERSNNLLFCLWCCRELILVRRYSVVKVRRLR